MSLYAVKNDEGKWLGCEVYCDEPDWFDHGGFIWDTRSIAEENVKLYGGHVVELVDVPAKVVVSEDEAEMLEQAKDDYCAASVISAYSTEHIGAMGQDRLMRAYVIGWTVEKPKRWNVKVPHATNSYYYDMGWGNGLETQDMKAGTQPLPGFREAQFTQDEINKRGLQDCERVEVTDDEQ